MEEFKCCVCLGDYSSPVILNSGITLCSPCKRDHQCPITRSAISFALPNGFVADAFRYPPPLPPLPPFSLEKLFESPDRIEYINQFGQIDAIIYDDILKFELLSIFEFKAIVDRCINLEYVDPYDMRMIHYVCIYGSLDMLQYLVSKNINLNCGDRYNERPIHHACKRNKLDMVKCLITHGAELNCITREGWHTMHYACICGDEALELVKYLVSCGANLNWNEEVVAYLHWACKRGDRGLQLAKYFVECGADVNRVDRNGDLPIHVACAHGPAFRLVKFLLSCGANVNCAERNGSYPIQIAYCRGDYRTALYLIKYGANFNDIRNLLDRYPILDNIDENDD